MCPAPQRDFLNLYATLTKKTNQLLQLLTKIFNFVIMARLVTAPKNTLHRDLPAKDKLQLALQFLRKHPKETPTTAARLYKIEKEDTVRKA